METLALEKRATSKLFWLIAGLVAFVLIWTARQRDPVVFGAAVLVAAAAVYPFYFWLMGWSQGLPMWPVFAFITGITAALPMVQAPEVLFDYTSAEILVGGMTVTGFILLGTVVWLTLTGRPDAPPAHVLMISRQHSERYLFAFILSGVLFQMNELAWWVNLPGNSMQVVRGISMSLNTMGIFVLAFYQGRGLLNKAQQIALAALTAATALLMASGLILAQAIIAVAMYVLGLTLGSGKIPWKAIAIFFCVAALLHPGKYTMRRIYWGEEREKQLTLSALPSYYWEWLGYGLEEAGVKKRPGAATGEEETPSSIFERGGNLHMLLLVQKKSPREVPFLNGITYEPIPRLLIPRFIDDQKGLSHAGNVLLTVNYGLQTLEQTATTSIGWGLVPEAYANFGYLGVAMLALLLGGFYGFVAKFTIGVPMTSLRFVIGLLVLAASTRADTMGVFITSQFQGIVGVSLAALVLMRRQPNPFAAEGGAGVWPEAYGLKQDARTERENGEHAASESARSTAGIAAAQIKPVGPAKWGGQKPPKWAPLSHRLEYARSRRVAESRESEAASRRAKAEDGAKQERKKPRQVAVPIQPYYYRSRRA